MCLINNTNNFNSRSKIVCLINRDEIIMMIIVMPSSRAAKRGRIGRLLRYGIFLKCDRSPTERVGAYIIRGSTVLRNDR